MGVRELGYITYVETSTRGSETSVAATLGDPAIVVADVSGFLPDGGLLDIGQALVPLGYTSAVRNADGLTGTLTLTDALAADVAEGTRVDLWARRGPSTYYTATVDTGAGEISATLPAHLIPHLEGGPRTDDEREYVECERQDSKWVVVDVLLQDPSVHLRYSKPATLPAAAVNEQDWAGDQVTARLVTATDMTAATITGATIQTARPEDGVRRAWMDADGIHQTSAGGVPRMDFPNTQGATNFLKGSLNADDLTVVDDAVMRSRLSISPGARIILDGGTTDPASPPVSLCDWESVVIQRPAIASYGLQRVSGAWYYVTSEGSRLVLRTFADDGSADTEVFADDGMVPMGGVVHVGTNWYALGGVGGTWKIRKYDALGSIVLTKAIAHYGFAGCSIGTDGTSLLVAYQPAGGSVAIDSYSASTLGLTASLTTALALGEAPVSVLSGSFDFGAARFVVADRGGTTAYVLNSAGVEQNSESFPIADAANRLAGMTWDGTNFYSIAYTTPKLYKYTDGAKTDTGSNLTYWVSSDWYQGAGTYHTKVSPAAKVIYSKRSRLQASMGNVPGAAGVDDPDSTRTFIGRGATDPGPAGSYLNATSTAGTGDTIVETPVFSGTTAPTTNTFPASGDPGVVKAADGSVIVRGDYSNSDDLPTRIDALEAGGGGGGTGSWRFVGGGSAFETGWGSIDGGDSAGTGSGNIYGGHA